MMAQRMIGRTVLAWAICVVTVHPTDVLAQSELPTRTVTVNSHVMRVWSAGLEGRTADQPVVILEAGGPGTLDSWRPVFAAIAPPAPVLAYDPGGLGKSGFDGERPTVTHVAQVLHALLDAAHIPPPYVLVGSSWGGVYIRGFTSLYPKEVVGLVYLDASDYERAAGELATVIPTT